MAGSGLLARGAEGPVPRAAPPTAGRAWSPGEGLALATPVGDWGGRYQICGPNAFNRYGFDEQVPTRTYAYNDRLSGDRTSGRSRRR